MADVVLPTVLPQVVDGHVVRKDVADRRMVHPGSGTGPASSDCVAKIVLQIIVDDHVVSNRADDVGLQDAMTSPERARPSAAEGRGQRAESRGQRAEDRWHRGQEGRRAAASRGR